MTFFGFPSLRCSTCCNIGEVPRRLKLLERLDFGTPCNSYGRGLMFEPGDLGVADRSTMRS